jgi:hypothetical protein
MDILKVEDICSVFRDILNVAFYVMDSLSPVGIALAEFFSVDHLEVGLDCGIGVYPEIDETIEIFDGVAALFGLLGAGFPGDGFAIMGA